jgi:type IV pilus biogenesis protein CpaD/CtpE
MTPTFPVDRNSALRIAAALVGLAAVLGACTHTDEVTTASVPDDYRLTHPIAIQEANQSIVIFVGQQRGGLSASQRADVMGLAQTWLREGTAAIVADVPVDTPNARTAADSLREIQALLASAGVQRNMAAMVDNPADLEQPRPETPAYTTRRTAAFEKYRKGTPTATTYPDAEKAKLSDTGK